MNFAIGKIIYATFFSNVFVPQFNLLKSSRNVCFLQNIFNKFVIATSEFIAIYIKIYISIDTSMSAYVLKPIVLRAFTLEIQYLLPAPHIFIHALFIFKSTPIVFL